MPTAPSAADLRAGGVVMFQAVHAVVEMVQRAPGEDGDLYQRFLALTEMINKGGNEVARRALTLSLTRLLFEAVKATRPSEVAARDPQPQKLRAVVEKLVTGQEPEVVRAALAAASAPNLPDYIRTVSYGTAAPVQAAHLGYAAVLVLRYLVTGPEGFDPATRWVFLGRVTQAVASAHYLLRR